MKRLMLVVCGLIISCSLNGPEKPATPTLTLMTFNVENLFDNLHDKGKNDLTYLPRIEKQSTQHKTNCSKVKVKKWREECLFWDWSDTAVEDKLKVLAAAILKVNNGHGPDVLVLQEVENQNIVEQLRTKYLSTAGYLPTVLIEGDDLRGIDVAFLTRLPVHGEPILHTIDFAGAYAERIADTRGILEVTFELPDGNLLTGFGIHFPAPFHPWQMRETAYQTLNQLKAALPEGRAVFAAGDFNTPSDEDQKHQLLDQYVRPDWIVAHDTGCEACRGTYYYAPLKQWSFLDMILWSAGAQNAWQYVPESTRVENTLPQQVNRHGYPHGYDLPNPQGVSDHWPISVKISRQ